MEMDRFLQVAGGGNNVDAEVASICPLITPSPPTNDLINPEPEPIDNNFVISEELASRLHHVHHQGDGHNKEAGDSASSSSSALAEPACTQLLNHRNNCYHHIVKDEHTATEETAGKVQPLQLTFRNPPDNYFFMTWNWPLIRKISLWLFLSGLVAMLALVIAMIVALPKTCNPHTEWYQGSVMYELFPASFYDSNHDQVGDFNGINMKAQYLKDLKVRAVRLNSIFQTEDYPEDYRNISGLIEIAPKLGNLTAFTSLVQKLHSLNISLLLDLPLHSVVKQLSRNHDHSTRPNGSNSLEPSLEFLIREQRSVFSDPVEEALVYWSSKGVDGFYLKGLEHLVNDPNLPQSLRKWKKIVGVNRPLIINEKLLETSPKSAINTILANVDLVDVRLKISNGVDSVRKQIDSVLNGTLFDKPGLPWIHWSLGDDSTERLSKILPYSNATLGANLLQLMLPGTVSIFYGDEIGLEQTPDSEGEHKDLKHLHQLAPMAFEGSSISKSLNWMPSSEKPNDFKQFQLISEMIGLRSESPAIYVNSVYKDGENRANAEIKYCKHDLLVIQRWYPRRKSYVVACNLGKSSIEADLSTLLYSGEVSVGPRVDSKPGSISFKEIALWPGETVVILLD